MNNDKDRGQVIALGQDGDDVTRLENTHACIDELIAAGATSILITSVIEDKEAGTRGYGYSRFGKAFYADRVLTLERARQYEMIELLNLEAKNAPEE